jgi:ADP-ribosylglycohydrolase
MEVPQMKERAEAMVLASFTADSLALGAHWIYDTAVIDNDLGRVETLRKPHENSFHRTKQAGEFTHYGDQSLVLLESIAANKGFDIDHFARCWRSFMDDYTGYRDHATKDTLKNFAAGKDSASSGSQSTELGGAVRIAPLVYALRKDPEKLVSAARRQTAMTHKDPLAVESAEYLADVLLRVLNGSSPSAALKDASTKHLRTQKMVEKGLETSGNQSRATIKTFGQMCDATDALPSVVHLSMTYENDLKSALIENVMAGGDSAARGMAVGMILGAHLGRQAIPDEWLQNLKANNQIIDLLGTIP